MSSQSNLGSTVEWTHVSETDTVYSVAASKHEPQVSSPSIESLLETVLGLREHERATYDAVRDNPGVSIKELAGTLDRDRSNVNRSITKLESVGLIKRHRCLLDSGGYYYANYAAPTDVLKEIVNAALEEWITEAQASVEEHCWDAPLGSTTDD